MLSFPLEGTSIAIDMPAVARHPAHRRPAQRVRDRRRWAHLPEQGSLHARRALRRDGAAPAPLLRAARQVGSARGGCAARSRCACSEIEHEGGDPRRHRRHRPRRRAAAGRARRRALPARARRGRACPQRRRLQGAPSAARATSAARAAISKRPTASPPRSTPPTPRSAASTRSSSPRRCSPSQDALEADVELARRLLTVNYANTVVFCEHARKRLLARGGGRLVVFSSVAGDRGRKPVAIYGSSQGGPRRLPRGARPQVPRRRARRHSASSRASSRRA